MPYDALFNKHRQQVQDSGEGHHRYIQIGEPKHSSFFCVEVSSNGEKKRSSRQHQFFSLKQQKMVRLLFIAPKANTGLSRGNGNWKVEIS